MRGGTMTTRLYAFAVLVLAGCALNPSDAADRKTLIPGDRVEEFILKDTAGVDRSLQSALESSNFVIVDFWSTKCPVSKRYEDRLRSIAEDYRERGVTVLAIMSNQTESIRDVTTYLEKMPLPYTIVIDPDSAIADRFGAETTPHIFVLDPKGRVRYTGGIDNGSKDPSKLKPHLREALDALLAGEEPPEAKTRNFGCSIKRKA
jgi:peroxiredoxin